MNPAIAVEWLAFECLLRRRPTQIELLTFGWEGLTDEERLRPGVGQRGKAQTAGRPELPVEIVRWDFPATGGLRRRRKDRIAEGEQFHLSLGSRWLARRQELEHTGRRDVADLMPLDQIATTTHERLKREIVEQAVGRNRELS